MATVNMFYGTETGNTRKVDQMIAKNLSGDMVTHQVVVSRPSPLAPLPVAEKKPGGQGGCYYYYPMHHHYPRGRRR